jgi:AGCS family alanine or glycine:cation symporter
MYLAMVFWGSSASLTQVWSMADVALGLMTLVNVIAIVQLTPTIVALTKDYNAKRKIENVSESDMEFKEADIEFQGKVEQGIWKK